MFDERQVENFILKRGVTRKKILDAGCGDGGLLIELAERNRFSELWCVDTYIEDAVNNINRKGFSRRIRCANAEAENIPLESRFFDFIYSIRSLHEFHNPTQALEEIKRLLASNGEIINGEIIIADWKKEAKTGVSERYYEKDRLFEFLKEARYNFRNVKLKEIGRFNILLYSQKGFST